MATNDRPVHGSGAQVSEFTIDLVGHGLDRPDVPATVDVVLSTDANSSLQLDVETPDEGPNWRFDVRVVRGALDLLRAFRAGEGVTPDEAPDWMDVVIQQTNQRFAGGL